MEIADRFRAGTTSARWFATTHWTVVLNAKSDNTVEARTALCQF